MHDLLATYKEQIPSWEADSRQIGQGTFRLYGTYVFIYWSLP